MNGRSMKWPRTALLGLVLLALPVSAQACAVCFGAPGSKDTQALSFAIVALLGVLTLVLGCIIAFFIHLARQARNAEALNFEAVREATGSPYPIR